MQTICSYASEVFACLIDVHACKIWISNNANGLASAAVII